MLKKIVFAPGINKEGTNYSAEGGWYDSDKIRFRKGRPEKIGGWVEQSADTIFGVCRKIHSWITVKGSNYLGLGTSSKSYIEYGELFYDITPSYDYSLNQVGPSTLVETLSSVGTLAKIPKDGVSNGNWIPYDLARITSPVGPSPALSSEYVQVTATNVGSTATYDTLTVTRSMLYDSTNKEHYYNVKTYRSPTLTRIPRAEVLLPTPATDPTTAVTTSPIGVMNGNKTVLIRQSGHGCIKGDYVTFLQLGSAVTGVGAMESAELTSPKGYRVSGLLNSDNYEIDIGTTGGSKITTTEGLLTAEITGAADQTIGVTTTSGSWPASSTYWIKIDDEYMKVVSPADGSVYVTARGQFSTLVTYHGKDAKVYRVQFVCPPTASAASGTYILHDINSGPAVYTESGGWGRSAFGDGMFGTNYVGESGRETGFRIWSIDNWGEDLILCPRDGRPYYWDASENKNVLSGIPYRSGDGTSSQVTSNTPLAQAVPLSTIGTSVDVAYSFSDATTLPESHVPDRVRKLVVYPASQQVIAFGCSDRSGNFDPMLIRWSSMGKVGSWDPWDLEKPGTTGSVRLNHGSEIITAARSKMEMLIWTDAAIFKMEWSGSAAETFSIAELATEISITGPLGYSVAGDQIFWMGDRNFYVYNGSISVLPCSVLSYVFSDPGINYSQKKMFFAAANPEFNEVIFFYSQAGSEDIDRYVSYNYEERVWAIGSMDRNAWSDSGLRSNPLASRIISSDDADNTSKIYRHESGTNDVGIDGTVKGMEAYIESAYFDIDDGDRFSFISRVIPDVNFTTGGAGSSDGMTLEIKKKDFPNDSNESTVSSSITSSTQQDFVRVRGRQAAVKFSTSGKDVGWRLGDNRIDIRQDGRR